MNIPPFDIGSGIPLETQERVREFGRWVAEHPAELQAAIKKEKACRAAYLRELKVGKPPKEPPDGYAKYVEYAGPSLRREYETFLFEKRKRSDRRWELVHRAASVAAILAAIAAIATLVITLVPLLHG